MQYLYVLTSSPNDIYYEQFLLSAASFRHFMPNAKMVLLCNRKTKDTLIGKRTEYEKYISNIITVDPPDTMPQIEVSRWLKTSMRRLVQGDFLYIDCDTIITDDLSSITERGIQLGGCLDKHSLIEKHHKRDSIIENDKKLGFNSFLSNLHINGGILYCADTPETHMIFDRWHELWLFCKSKNIIRDMPSLNQAIYENFSLFTELDGTWNCQIAFNGLPFLVNSKIIHYFATDLFSHASPFSLASDEIFNNIKETGTIPEQALKLLKNPRAAFVPESRIIAGQDVLSVLNSNNFEVLFWTWQKMPGLFKCINQFSSICKKIVKFFIIRAGKKKDGGIKYYN